LSLHQRYLKEGIVDIAIPMSRGVQVVELMQTARLGVALGYQYELLATIYHGFEQVRLNPSLTPSSLESLPQYELMPIVIIRICLVGHHGHPVEGKSESNSLCVEPVIAFGISID